MKKSWVEFYVEDVYHCMDGEENNAIKKSKAANDSIVAVEYAIDKPLTEAGDGKDTLYNEAAHQDVCCNRAEVAQNGQYGIFKDMVGKDLFSV